MKRLFVLPVVLLFVCGCSNVETTKPMLNNITFTAQVEYDEYKYVCNVDSSNNALNLVVLEPEEIKDLILRIDETSMLAEFKGIKYTIDVNLFPQCAMLRIIYDVFTDAASKECLLDDENCLTTGEIGGYVYELVFSPSGLPLSLSIEDLNLKMLFNNVIIK